MKPLLFFSLSQMCITIFKFLPNIYFHSFLFYQGDFQTSTKVESVMTPVYAPSPSFSSHQHSCTCFIFATPCPLTLFFSWSIKQIQHCFTCVHISKSKNFFFNKTKITGVKTLTRLSIIPIPITRHPDSALFSQSFPVSSWNWCLSISIRTKSLDLSYSVTSLSPCFQVLFYLLKKECPLCYRISRILDLVDHIIVT